MRFLLALRCFFLILFYKRLPEDAAALLPARKPDALPPPEAELVTREPQPAKVAAPKVAVAPVTETKPVEAQTDGKAELTRGAVQLLALLQREGRLLDFLQEEIDGYSDDQIGAAVRDIHRGCKKVLAEHAPLEPVLPGQENASVRVDAGFDPSRIRLTGNVVGEPPFTGTLRHHGWRTAKVVLPERTGTTDPTVVAPAEVEL
jgi:hypothetical protein